jgi:hypothetical protein
MTNEYEITTIGGNTRTVQTSNINYDTVTSGYIQPNWITTSVSSTPNLSVKQEVEKVLKDNDYLLISKTEFEEMQESIKSLRSGYFALYTFLTGNEAKSLPEALEGLKEVLEARSLDEVLIDKAKKEALLELGEKSERL